MTVSRYLRNPSQVSAALQTKIAVALDELGYRQTALFIGAAATALVALFLDFIVASFGRLMTPGQAN